MSENSVIIIPEGSALNLKEDVEQLGRYLIQMGTMMQSMQRRMDELEEKQKKVTICHADVLDLNRMLRIRSMEICEKYGLRTEKSQGAMRNAMKKAVLQRYGIKDLHDIPEIAIRAVQAQIDHYANIRLVMDLRAREEPDPRTG